jgi:predicted dinucleotide-utilizing enzyme
MSDAGKLSQLSITMKKHPESLYPAKGTPEHALNESAKADGAGEVVVFDGSARVIAGIFPVNVNTMCTAGAARPSLHDTATDRTCCDRVTVRFATRSCNHA